MVASILLMKRHGGIKEETLLQHLVWLYNEILARKGAMSMNMAPTLSSLRVFLKLLENFIDTKKPPFVKVSSDYKDIQMLAYYRNNLIHMFLNESYVATAFQSFGEDSIQSQGVQVMRLWDQTEFLIGILKEEFVQRNQIHSKECFLSTIVFMQSRGFITITGGEPG
jgi:glycerol-3-phosphate O-acyltransferase